MKLYCQLYVYIIVFWCSYIRCTSEDIAGNVTSKQIEEHWSNNSLITNASLTTPEVPTLSTIIFNNVTLQQNISQNGLEVSVPIDEKSIVHTCGVRDPVSGEIRHLRIMTSSTDEYFPVFMNWLVYFHRICPNIPSIYFICLDTIIEKKLANYGLTCAFVHHIAAKGVNDVWLVRTRLTHTLLSQGYDVLLTDADALWLRNPFPYIEAHISSDVISSRGSYPEGVSSALGAALCMGFVYIKASEHTAKLWGAIAADMVKHPNPDDQRDVNNHLKSLGLHYTPRPRYIGSTEANTGNFRHHSYNFGVTLLPHTLFPRICDMEKKGTVQGAVVLHCLSHEKKGNAKMSTAEALGMWRLRKDWQQVQLQSDMESYLNAITVQARTVRSMLGSNTIGDNQTTLHRKQSSLLLRGSMNNDVIDTDSSPVCLEYHRNRHIFDSVVGRTTQTCWYVSTSAPEDSIRRFEELVSKNSDIFCSEEEKRKYSPIS